MWARLDDALLDHRKIFAAGEAIGKNGPAIALGMYTVALLWANKHLSDGYLPLPVVKSFRHVADPVAVGRALVEAGLWERNGSGFVIHDYADFGNPSAAAIKARRKWDRQRKHKKARGDD